MTHPSMPTERKAGLDKGLIRDGIPVISRPASGMVAVSVSLLDGQIAHVKEIAAPPPFAFRGSAC